MGILSDADGLSRSHANSRGPFEKDLRALLAIDVGVETFAGAVLGIAKRSAGFVSAAARPDFLGMNWNLRECALAMRGGKLCRQLGERYPFFLRTRDQPRDRVFRNRPR